MKLKAARPQDLVDVENIRKKIIENKKYQSLIIQLLRSGLKK